jgi:hypothetical protein
MTEIVGSIAMFAGWAALTALLWRATRWRRFGPAVYIVGPVGAAAVVASVVARQLPGAVFGIGASLTITAAYGWMLLRERKRGGGLLEAGTIEYGPTLTTYERAVFMVLGAGMVVLAYFCREQVGICGVAAALGLWAGYTGISGRSPRPSRIRSAAPKEGPRIGDG